MAEEVDVADQGPSWAVFKRALAAIERVLRYQIQQIPIQRLSHRATVRPPTLLPPLFFHQSDVKALQGLYGQYGEVLTNRLLPDGTGGLQLI